MRTYNIFLGKYEGKRQLGIPRRRLEDNIKVVLPFSSDKVINMQKYVCLKFINHAFSVT